MPRTRFAQSLLACVILTLAACGGRTRGAGDLPTLALTGAVPANGPLEGGMPLTLRGRGFLAGGPPSTAFAVIGTQIVGVYVSSNETIELTLPPGRSGAADVSIVLDGRAAHATNAFAYDPPAPRVSAHPTIGSHSPASGGTRITIGTTGFDPLVAPGITFGGVPATDIDVIDDTTVIARVPAGVDPNRDVQIVVSQGPRVAITALFHSAPVAEGDLIVNELLANAGNSDANRDGAANASGDEFVELVNVSGRALDLSAVRIHDGTSLRHTFPNPTTLPPGGAIVVFGSGTPIGFAPPHASGHAQTTSTGSLGLNNGGDQVAVRTPSGDEVFQIDYDAAGVLAGVSQNSFADGLALPTPTSVASSYLLHDSLPEAEGAPQSPGRRADGGEFPRSK